MATTMVPNLAALKTAEMPSDATTQYLVYFFNAQLSDSAKPAFDAGIDECYQMINAAHKSANTNQQVMDKLHKVIGDLYSFVQSYESNAGSCMPDEQDVLREQLLLNTRSLLFNTISWKLCNVIEKVYSIGFAALKTYTMEATILADIADQSCSSSADECSGCGRASSECVCLHITTHFNQLRNMLQQLGILDGVCGDAIVKVAGQTIDEKVAAVTTASFDNHNFQVLEEWLEDSLCRWLQYCDKDGSDGSSRQRALLHHRLHLSFARSIIGQLFDCIVDYPDSKPALFDLKDCLKRVSLRSELVCSLQDDIMNRLLHPGVNTTQVLVAYTQAVKSLRLVDPSGVIMDIVCQPIRHYIRNRSDSVRCVVSLLTERGQLNASGQQLVLFESAVDEDNDEFNCYHNQSGDQSIGYETDNANDDGIFGVNGAHWARWKPDPVDADPGEQSEWRRSADMVSMLVGIYGSRELFVNEYRQLLSERLLRQPIHHTETETRYLELLKSKFGDAELHHCEVMLKDMKDSQRVNDYIKETPALNMAIPISARILSSHFWPKLREDRLKLPDSMQHSLQQYKRAYETFKVSRTLEWTANLGTVELELEIGGQSLSLTATPLQAAIIHKFAEKVELTGGREQTLQKEGKLFKEGDFADIRSFYIHLEEQTQHFGTAEEGNIPLSLPSRPLVVELVILETWSTDELSASLHVTTSAVRRRLTLCAQLGIIRETKNKGNWQLCDTLPTHTNHQLAQLPTDLSQEEDEDEQQQANTDNQLESLEQYWPYVQNMLNSLNALKAERLHTLIRMFNSPGQEGPSLETVTTFLQRKVAAQMLTHQNGLYKLPKK